MSTTLDLLFFINGPHLLTFIIFLAAVFFLFLGNERNLPPGPFNLPIFGYVPFMVGKKVDKAFWDLKATYGDIVYLKLGATKMVALNSYEAIKEALLLNPEIAISRPEDFSAVNYLFDNIGYLVDNGKIWQEQRRFLMRTLRDLGLGNQNLQSQIGEEASVLVGAIQATNEKSFDPQQLFTSAAANIITALIFGIKYKYDDPVLKELLHLMIKTPNRVSPFKVVNSFPYIRFILPNIASGMTEVIEAKRVLEEYLDKRIEAHKLSEESGHNYLHTYVNKINEDSEGSITDTTFTYGRCRSNLLMLNVAGISTTAGSIYWALKMLIIHQDIQEKLHTEIDSVIGHDRLPSYTDKPNMPYTDAFLMEVQRYGDVVPLGVPHATRARTKIAGYDIPKGTTIMPLLYLVHGDPKLWGDPENFRPQRFLSADGRIIKSEYLIPFSIGKRSCPGENLALPTTFMFLTSLLQVFKFVAATPEDLQVNIDPIGFTRDVSPFQIVAHLRH